MSWTAKCECGNRDPKKFREDEEQGELICVDCGRVSTFENENSSGTSELLGSISDPLYRPNGLNHEFVDSIRRVEKTTLPNWSEFVWLKLVEDLSDRSNAPQHVRDSLLHFYHFNRTSVKNLRRREVATALLYIYSKSYMKSHQSLSELCKTVGANPMKTRKYLSQFAFEHNLKPTYRPPEDYVSVFSSRMNLEKRITERGVELASLYQERAFSCCTPRTVAASALYLATRENGHMYTQDEIGEACGIAGYTVREVSAKMKKTLGL